MVLDYPDGRFAIQHNGVDLQGGERKGAWDTGEGARSAGEEKQPGRKEKRGGGGKAGVVKVGSPDCVVCPGGGQGVGGGGGVGAARGGGAFPEGGVCGARRAEAGGREGGGGRGAGRERRERGGGGARVLSLGGNGRKERERERGENGRLCDGLYEGSWGGRMREAADDNLGTGG